LFGFSSPSTPLAVKVIDPWSLSMHNQELLHQRPESAEDSSITATDYYSGSSSHDDSCIHGELPVKITTTCHSTTSTSSTITHNPTSNLLHGLELLSVGAAILSNARQSTTESQGNKAGLTPAQEEVVSK